MKNIFKIVLVGIFNILCITSFAGIEPVNARVQGADLYDLKGSVSTLDIADNKYWIMADGYWDTEFTVKSVSNTISLGIDESDMTFSSASFAYRITLNVDYKQLSGTSLSNSSIDGIILDISYNPARGTVYKDRSVYSFANGLDVKVEVVTIEKLVGEVWEEVVSSTLPSSLFLESEIITERYYPFSQIVIPTPNTIITVESDELKVVWPFIEGAEEYELEWTWVNGFSGEISDSDSDPELLAASVAKYNFDLNATRVRLKGKNTYSIPLIYGQGYILVRYRGIGKGGNDFTIPLEGQWSSEEVSLPGSVGTVSAYGSLGVNYITVTSHESNEINYGAGMSFIENGVRSVGVTYMDGVLKPRQSQAKLNGQDKIIAGSTIYDHYGRPAIGVMSSPVNQSTLGYIDDLNMFAVGVPYGKQHFDLDIAISDCGENIAAPPMNTSESSGAANYYSDDNPDKEGFNAYLPDAEGYPFVQVEYAKDPTGRITRVGGLGQDHQIGRIAIDGEIREAHFTEYFYTTVDDYEMFYLFGNDAIDGLNYTKTIIKDVHGQLSVAIIDPMGRTLVTYMEGASPDQLERIDGNSDVGSASTTTFANPDPDAEDYNIVEELEGSLEVNYPLFVADPDEIYTFNYDFTAANFSDCLLPDVDLCFDCIYDIQISIISDDPNCEILNGAGDVISTDGIANMIYTLGSLEAFDPSSCNDSPLTFSGENGADAATFTVKFPNVGNYQITKNLTVSNTPLDYYWELYKNNSTCLLDESTFIEEALTYIDPSDCDDLGPCEMSFLLENGTLTMYLEENPGMTEADYNALFDSFLETCQTTNSCDYLKMLMEQDFNEGGQYNIADLIEGHYDGDDASTALLNALFEMDGGFGNWRDFGPFYEADGVTESVMVDYLGATWGPPYGGISISEFADNWRNSWTENFIRLHPEYCYYTFCGDFPELFEYEHDLNAVDTYVEACSLGLINPFDPSYGLSLAGCISNLDPVFVGIPLVPASLSGDISTIANEEYEYETDVFYDIYEYAVIIAGDAPGTVFGTGCNADRHWIAFRSLYFSKRFRIIDLLKSAYIEAGPCSNYVECIGVDTGSDCAVIVDGTTYYPFVDKMPRYYNFESDFFDLDPDFDWDTYTVPEDGIEEACLDMCEGLADTWMGQLIACGDLIGEDWVSAPDLDPLSIYYKVRLKLVEVCSGGCDGEWAFPTQVDLNNAPDGIIIEVDPSDEMTWIFPSFESVITHFIPTAETIACTHLLITNPLPSKGDETLINYLDDCACNALLSTTTIEEFELVYGFAPIDYSIERCYCEGYDSNVDFVLSETEANLLDLDEIFTPNFYSCGSICVDCNTLQDPDFPLVGYLPEFEAALDGATYLTEPLLFTAFVNEQSGGTYTYDKLLELINNCEAIKGAAGTPVYHLLDPKTKELRDLLNKLADGGLLTTQPGFTQLTLPEYLNSSLYPCDDADVATYTYTPTLVGSILSFNLTNEDCSGSCTFDLFLVDGVPLGFDNAAEVYENIVSFGELYMLTPLSSALKTFYMDVIVSDGDGGTVETTIRLTNICYDFVTDYLSYYQLSPIFKICSGAIVPEEENCLDLLIEEAENTGKDNYEEYILAKEAEFKQDYIIACTNVNETFKVDYLSNRYHYTLLYYDQSGNLVKTVPPKGVNPLTDVSGVIDHIEDDTNPPVFPDHTFKTTYKHNSLNQVISVNTPDGGTSHYFYDKIGRLVVSQSAKQADFNTTIIDGDWTGIGLNIPTYSYTLYDDLGRVIEVGEIVHPAPMTKTIAKSPSNLEAWLNQTSALVEDVTFNIVRNNITQMYYDTEYSAAASVEFGEGSYGYTRNRIVATSVITGYVHHEDGVWNYPQPDYINHYKYDIHGNVQTYLQEITALVEHDNRFRRVDYDYDLISGNPNYIYYQKGKADQYIHKYIYDKDNRLKEVFTSSKGLIWDRDVNYEYREDGYLARAEIGEMKVQGMDYAYTLHGWLKTLNSGVLNADFDMGRDGDRDPSIEYSSLENEVHGMVAQDALAYTIGYYNGDYKAISDGDIGFENMQIDIPSASAFNSDKVNLYNGNITSLITNLTDFEGNKLNVHANTYHYDQLHRFKEMHVFQPNTDGSINATNSLSTATRKNYLGSSFDITVAGVASTTLLGDYEVHVDYDKNGNITKLVRNSNNITGLNDADIEVTDNGMDEFSYIYSESGTNKLTRVTDNNDNNVLTIDGDAVDFGDIKNGQTGDNYEYFPDGSLKSDLDEEIAYIDWYPSGKIKRIYRTTLSEQSDIYFEYSPMGIRTLKVEMTRTGTVLNDPSVWKYTYYADDANGTTLAIYQLDENDQYNTLVKTEAMLYGGSRLGIDVDKVTVSGFDTPMPCNEDGRASFIFEIVGPADESVSYFGEDVTITFDGSTIADISDWTSPDYSVYEIISDINASTLDLEAELISGGIVGDQYIAQIEVTELVAGTFTEGTAAIYITDDRVSITETRSFTVGDCYSERNLGLKYYELSNHLGNVMEVITDRKITVDDATFDALTGDLVTLTSDGVIDYFSADIVQYSDYYPYGMTMPGRNGSVSEKYRYAFNGMETDQEVSGSGNSYTTQFRQYDPRLGRWKSLDPLATRFPWQSPFNGMDDNPIALTDRYGLSTQEDKPKKGKVKWNKRNKNGESDTDENGNQGDAELNPIDYTYKRTFLDKIKYAIKSIVKKGSSRDRISEKDNNTSSGNSDPYLDGPFVKALKAIERYMMGDEGRVSFGIVIESDNYGGTTDLGKAKLKVNGHSITIKYEDLMDLFDLFDALMTLNEVSSITRPHLQSIPNKKKWSRAEMKKMRNRNHPDVNMEKWRKWKKVNKMYDKHVQEIQLNNQKKINRFSKEFEDFLNMQFKSKLKKAAVDDFFKGDGGNEVSVVKTPYTDSSMYIWDVTFDGVMDTFWSPSESHDTLYQNDF